MVLQNVGNVCYHYTVSWHWRPWLEEKLASPVAAFDLMKESDHHKVVIILYNSPYLFHRLHCAGTNSYRTVTLNFTHLPKSRQLLIAAVIHCNDIKEQNNESVLDWKKKVNGKTGARV